MAVIKSIYAYEIIDSKGYPTIEATLTLDSNIKVTTSVPSGTTQAKYAAIELRDGDDKRFDGKGVTRAVSYINQLLAPKLVGISPLKQQEIDYWLIKADNTPNKSVFGANTLLIVSQLMAKAAAVEQGVPLFQYLHELYKKMFKSDSLIERIPSPIFNMINGGRHANNNIEFQEFQIIPSSSRKFGEAYQMGIEVFHELKQVLEYRGANISLGEEGGFTPNFTTNLDALEVMNETVQQKNLKAGLDIFFGLDLASDNFYKDDRYVVKDKQHPLKLDEYIEFMNSINSTYSMLILEDPLRNDDWEGWKKMADTISEQIYLAGDNFISGNKERLTRAIKDKTISAVVLKLNEIGTVTEAMSLVDLAKKNNITVIVSHRSGETNDNFIADFAVGIQADFVKFGAPARGERVVKYNRLWQIERDELKL